MIPEGYTAGRRVIRFPCCLFLIRGIWVSPLPWLFPMGL